MPAIIVKDYNWRQTAETVIIQVPLVGHPKNVSLFVTENYVKASYPPFILELFLYANVDEEKSECALSEKEVVFSLQKIEIGLQWPALQVEYLDKEIKRKYRNRALERAQKIAEDRAKAKSEKRQFLQKEAVRAQIDLDTNTLNKIEATRDAHRKEAMREFDDWKSKAEMPIFAGVEGELQENRKAIRPPLKWYKGKDETLKNRPLTNEETRSDTSERTENHSTESQNNKIVAKGSSRKDINFHETSSSLEKPTGTQARKKEQKAALDWERSRFEDESSCTEDSESDNESSRWKNEKTNKKNENIQKLYEKKKKGRPGQDYIDRVLNGKPRNMNGIFDEPSKAVPLPRKPGTINVTFSERVFPTPARESSHLQEQEWLSKQAEARRQTGFVAEDLRPEERDPQWLKDKGDEFFKAGNHLAAISAYSHGIKLSEKMASLYVNRSAAHYALGNYFRCTEDCTKALELMEPKCEGNRESRSRCHARRGAALCKLSAPQHGIPELEEALKLAPGNESIKQDLLAAKQYFNISN